ncbi:mediator of RNA polymerase II transcription subunit 5 [Echria macrotheca]|uniref:Mediator of RNA polymerase II transcription subunit 5 n=1 Tax=Echria macrotheca TaxID=438768 RepID=A0AAJ0BCS5_9PEZI|nr:mediator of RNA polymerase II transcription subunit 5 [Echria macrotheca]
MFARKNKGARAREAVAQWQDLLTQARLRRLDEKEFEPAARRLQNKHPFHPDVIADLLLQPPKPKGFMLDSRVPQFLDVLLRLQVVNTPSVLLALHKYSTLHSHAPPSDHGDTGTATKSKKAGARKPLPPQQRWAGSYSMDELVFFRLSKNISQGTGIRTLRQAFHVAAVVCRWMELFTDVMTALSRTDFATMQSLQTKAEVEATHQAFAHLVMSMCENPLTLAMLEKPHAAAIRAKLSQCLQAFMPSTMQTAANMAQRLEQFRTVTLASFEPASKKDDTPSYMDMIQLDNVQIREMPVVNSRAGLYIYIGAALVGRPLLDDTALFGYLHNRYQGDLQATAIDLILASFDVLANAVFRNEGVKNGHLLKSYVVNKVPLILVTLAASSSHLYPFNAQFCITQALGQVDTNIFPTLSGLFDMNNNSSFQDSVRQDFCFACQLHGLLSQSAIEALLGDITYQSLPDEGRYVKEALVQSCLEDPEKTHKLIGELDNMNGNVGAAAQAIVEVMVTLCRNKETMTLKHLCTMLASKPLSLDILLLFNSLQKTLHPLCEVLDNWGGYDEDQGEYQPVYEEFGSILLLLMAFVYRYNLTPADLGIQSPNSFVGRLMTSGHLARPLDELNEQEKSHLGGWIRGLFDTEAGGLGDELMSSCPPQSYYLLMPTLFDQVVLAFGMGCLTEDQLKGGLEYLVDVLLLPSLVPALLYLSDLLWTHPANNSMQGQKAIIRILQLIVRPNSISSEASTMLGSVLYIVAKPLDRALRTYQRRDPQSQDVEPLLKALKEVLPLSRRTGAAEMNELESWSGAHSAAGSPTNGGLSATVRHTVQTLIQWSQNPTLNGMPTPYTHRQSLVALQMLGAKGLLGVLLEELKAVNDSDAVAVAYDVATAMVCAPDSSTEASTAATNNVSFATAAPQRSLSLREALKAEAQDWKRIQKTDPVLAEAVVRLYRRVEAQMVPPPPPPPAMLQADDLGVLGAAELGQAMAASAVDPSIDAMSLDTTGLDAAGVDLGDLGGLVSATGSAGGLDLGGDDIFGGLSAADFGADLMGWGDMEVG